VQDSTQVVTENKSQLSDEAAEATYVVYRNDLPRRRGGKSTPPGAALSEEGMESVMELVSARTEELETIVHGMRWPGA